MSVISNLTAIVAAIVVTFSDPPWAREVLLPPPSPYAGEQQRAVKSLSAEAAADLAAGRGMGFSKVAELNHYPGPKHVLELAQSLALTPAQLQDIKRIHAAMEQEARRLGGRIVAKEAELEALFAARRADDASARSLIAELGKLQGELRFAHVQAHLFTSRVLSSAQIAAYDELRGYVDKAAVEHQPHH